MDNIEAYSSSPWQKELTGTFRFELCWVSVLTYILAWVQMAASMKAEDRLDGANNFRAWKHRVMVILEEFDLLDFVEKDLLELDGA